MLRINSSEISVTLSTTRVGFNSLSFPSFGGDSLFDPANVTGSWITRNSFLTWLASVRVRSMALAI
jgi:hypothetical protein